MLHLVHNFFLQIPGQNQQEVRTGRGDFLGGMDRNVRSRQEVLLLVGTAIDRVVNEIRAHATVVQQSVSFGWSPISYNGLSVVLGRYEKFQKTTLSLPDLLFEGDIALKGIEASGLLPPQQIRLRGRRLVCFHLPRGERRFSMSLRASAVLRRQKSGARAFRKDDAM